MTITADQVKQLREKTGAGMMDCKRALEKTGGDMDKATDFLREQGITKATQKASRTAKEGLIFSTLAEKDKLGVLVELNCETDFVARTDDFRKLADETADWIIKNKPTDIKQVTESIKDAVNQVIAKLGENINVRRFALFQMDDNSDGIIHNYIHPGDKLGVLVELTCKSNSAVQDQGFRQLAKDIAMQIAATNPLVVTRDGLDSDLLEKEKDIYRTQAKNEGKPDKILDRIVQGKLEKYFQEVCLLEQPFVKDQDRTVQQRIEEVQGKLGEEICVGKFARFRLGDENS
jgi:elongation factor Ts